MQLCTFFVKCSIFLKRIYPILKFFFLHENSRIFQNYAGLVLYIYFFFSKFFLIYKCDSFLGEILLRKNINTVLSLKVTYKYFDYPGHMITINIFWFGHKNWTNFNFELKFFSFFEWKKVFYVFLYKRGVV